MSCWENTVHEFEAINGLKERGKAKYFIFSKKPDGNHCANATFYAYTATNIGKIFFFGQAGIELMNSFINPLPLALGVLCGSVVKCLTRNQEVPGSSRTVFHGSVLGQDTLESQPSTGETQERHA